MNNQTLQVDDEFRSIIPPLQPDEYEILERSLVVEGCRDAIVVWNNTIVDGHNRYEICTKHNIPFKTVEREFESRDDAKIWIIQNQFARRNISPYQRAKLALQLEDFFRAKAKESYEANVGRPSKSLQNLATISHPKIDTREELARIANVSHGTLAKVRVIEEKAPPKLKKKLEQNETSIHRAYTQIKREEEKRKQVKAAKPLPNGKFDTIYADPPWQYEFSASNSRSIESHYPTMSLQEICNLNVPAGENAILFLWCPSPKLPEGLKVIEAWGFVYKTNMVWVKDQIGMGYYTRSRHELLLIATKGKPGVPLPENRPGSVIEAPRLKHSQKPEIVYELIEQMYPHKQYIELFARNKRSGWEVWGNEI